jgi:hypothetical protein
LIGPIFQRVAPRIRPNMFARLANAPRSQAQRIGRCDLFRLATVK